MVVRDFAAAEGLDFVVLFGSQARGQAGPESDFDLALMPHGDLQDRDQVEERLVARLARGDLDMVWLPHASWLLASRVALEGKVLYEREPWQFHRFALRSALRRADSLIWSRRNKEFVERVLNRNHAVDKDLVESKLARLAQYLVELSDVLQTSESEFVTDFRLHRTAERSLELMVESAASINTEVAQAVAKIPPSDYYSSFFSIASAGWVDREVATRLATMAGLRNRLVHQYEDVDLKKLYGALKRSLPDWQAYLGSVKDSLG